MITDRYDAGIPVWPAEARKPEPPLGGPLPAGNIYRMRCESVPRNVARRREDRQRMNVLMQLGMSRRAALAKLGIRRHIVLGASCEWIDSPSRWNCPLGAKKFLRLHDLSAIITDAPITDAPTMLFDRREPPPRFEPGEWSHRCVAKNELNVFLPLGKGRRACGARERR